MAHRVPVICLCITFAGILLAQPRHAHILKVIPLPIVNPLHQTVQFGYEYHYSKLRGVHIEAGYYDNALIYSDYTRLMHGVKLRAEHRFYVGRSRISALHQLFLAPHVLYQSGALHGEREFSRFGGEYFETMRVRGSLTQVGLGMTYGSYLDSFGEFVVELSVQVGVKAHRAVSHMPEDIPGFIFPFPWRNTSMNTWNLRPMINVTLGLGFGWKALKG